jgi:AraC-like DNA-binding protein
MESIGSGKRNSTHNDHMACDIIVLTETTPQAVVLDPNHVHFFFARESDVVFEFSPFYSRELKKGNYFLLYDQNRELPVLLKAEQSKLLYVTLPPSYIHQILLADNEEMVGLNFNGFGVKEYSEHPISPDSDVVVEDLLNGNPPTSLIKLYQRAKVLELLSYCYDVPKESRYENCPFLKDKENVERIKQARDILVSEMVNPPSLPELAKLIGMNEYNLKVGFKNVYGIPPFKYLHQHKLNFAKRLLRNKQLQVNEIADEIGYKTSSHFIDAFKKQFGVTPKKYQE